MAKQETKNIHPKKYKTKVILTDKSIRYMMYSKKFPNDELHLDTCPKSHRAWTKDGSFSSERGSRVNKFKNKFPGMK